MLFGAAGSLTVSATTADSVANHYLMLAAALLTAIVFAFLKLPVIKKHNEASECSKIMAELLSYGVVGIFCVGAEVAIGSFLVNYFADPNIAGLEEHAAAKLIGYYWGGAMVGRFIGSLLKTVAPSLWRLTLSVLSYYCSSSSGNIALISVLAVVYSTQLCSLPSSHCHRRPRSPPVKARAGFY